jgi:hypothetical protein
MAMAPQFERERMVNEAVALATKKIGKPSRVWVEGDRIFVGAGHRIMVLRGIHSNSVGPDGVAMLGGGSWSFEEFEVPAGRGRLRWFASLLLHRLRNRAAVLRRRTER